MPRISPRTALEASRPVASLLSLVNWLSASASPIRTMVTKTSRRTTRRRVCEARETPLVAEPRGQPAGPADHEPVDREGDREGDEHGDRAVDPVAVRLPEGLLHEHDPANLASSMTTRAVFLDALGTLVELEPPWTRSRAARSGEMSDERDRARLPGRDGLLPRARRARERPGVAGAAARRLRRAAQRGARAGGRRRDDDGGDPLSPVRRRRPRRSAGSAAGS